MKKAHATFGKKRKAPNLPNCYEEEEPTPNTGNDLPTPQKARKEAEFTVTRTRGLQCHILQLPWINQGILRVSQAQKKERQRYCRWLLLCLDLGEEEPSLIRVPQ